MDVLKVETSEKIPSGYEIVIHGGRTPTGMDALWWAQEGERLGAGELCVNSIDADGTKEGYEMTLTKMITDAVGIPVIASGGAGHPEHLRAVLAEANADAALIASITHYGEYTVGQLKEYLDKSRVKIRRTW
jgi:cyclase